MHELHLREIFQQLTMACTRTHTHTQLVEWSLSRLTGVSWWSHWLVVGPTSRKSVNYNTLHNKIQISLSLRLVLVTMYMVICNNTQLHNIYDIYNINAGKCCQLHNRLLPVLPGWSRKGLQGNQLIIILQIYHRTMIGVDSCTKSHEKA